VVVVGRLVVVAGVELAELLLPSDAGASTASEC